MSKVRDIQDAYLRARIEDYRAYVRSGQPERAEQVAMVLRDRHGYNVEEPEEQAVPEPDVEERAEAPAPEKATADPMPEAAVEPKPQPAGPEVRPTAAKKTAAKRTPAKPAEGK